MIANTTDKTALARLEDYLLNSDAPRHVIDGFYHIKSLIGTLELAEEKSRQAWQEAEDIKERQCQAIETLRSEIAVLLGRDAQWHTPANAASLNLLKRVSLFLHDLDFKQDVSDALQNARESYPDEDYAALYLEWGELMNELLTYAYQKNQAKV